MAAICAMNVIARAGAKPVKVTAGKKYADIKAATKAGLVQGCAPFPEGVDFFGFFHGLLASPEPPRRPPVHRLPPRHRTAARAPRPSAAWMAPGPPLASARVAAQTCGLGGSDGAFWCVRDRAFVKRRCPRFSPYS